MSEIELEVERQLLFPGDTLIGKVLIQGPGPQKVSISIHGEEVYRPYLGFDTIVPVHDESIVVDCHDGVGSFTFQLPDDLSPSYSGAHLSCAYYLKGIRAKAQQLIAGFSRDAIARLHLTVGPGLPDYESSPHLVELKDENLQLEVQVDQVSVDAGESLTGSFLVTRVKDDGKLPKSIVFSLAAIEEGTRGRHRKVLWRMENSVQPAAEMAYPLSGSFEFPVDAATPTSGDWKMFKVHCGFRVRVDWGDHDQRESLPIQLCHPIIPQSPARFAVDVADREPAPPPDLSLPPDPGV